MTAAEFPRRAAAATIDGGGRRGRFGTFMSALLCVVVAAGGGALVWIGSGGGDAVMPLPPEPVVAAQGQPVTGPMTAVVDGILIDPAADPAPAPAPGEAGRAAEAGHGQAAPPPPSSLYIPALGAVSPVQVASVTETNLLRLPHDPNRLAIWDGGSRLEDTAGVKLVGGHVTNGWRKGALYRLASLQAGNVAYTTDNTGVVHVWQLETLRSVPRANGAAAAAAVEGDALVVLTCGGPVMTVNGERVYRDNVVAVFRPA